MFKNLIIFCVFAYLAAVQVSECNDDNPTEIFASLNEIERGVFYKYFLKLITQILTYEIDDPNPKQLELFESIPNRIEFAGKLYTWILKEVVKIMEETVDHSITQGIDIKERSDKGPVKYLCFDNGVCVDIDVLPSSCCTFT